MDVAFDLKMVCLMYSIVRVSILVLVDVAFDLSVMSFPVIRIIVSILVLVDVAFDQPLTSTGWVDFKCFNPCFSGCCF